MTSLVGHYFRKRRGVHETARAVGVGIATVCKLRDAA
jgi:hypothetical protein